MTARPSTPLDQRSQQELCALLAATKATESGTRASLVQAQADLARAEELARRVFLPRAQLEAARTLVSIGQASLEQGRAEERAVKIGQVNDEFGEVLSGLAVDDSVILNPGNALEDGIRISMR